MKNAILSNDEIMLGAGITQEQINAVKTANATNAVNFLEAIHNTLISFVATQRIEAANLDNPLRMFEKGYAAYNDGKMNGMFQEILVPTRAKGDNNLYGGKKHVVKEVRDPWTTQDYGADPLSYIYGINTKINRFLDYNRDDFSMALKYESLGDYIAAKMATLEAENNGSRYIIENNVLNCEAFQYETYANAESFANAEDLNSFLHKVWAEQRIPEANTKYKKVKFNTTRKNSNLVFVFDTNFIFDFAQKFTFKQYMKPFIFRSEDSDTYGAQEERSTIVEIGELTPTTLAENTILDPLNMQAATLPAGKKLVGRIIDWNAVKFGIGLYSSVQFPLDAVTNHYDEVRQYVFNMCPAYVNVPIIIDANFRSDRIISVQNVTPTVAARSK